MNDGDREGPASSGLWRREAAQAPLAVLPAVAGEWTCRELRVLGSDRFEAKFRHRDGSQLEITVGPKDGRAPAFLTLERCAVRYQGRLTRPTDEARVEAAALVRAVGLFVDERLRLAQEAAEPGVTPTLADALGRRHREAPVVFSREALRELLAPEVTLGTPLAGGFSLRDVYPDSRLPDGALRLVLDFRSDDERLRIGVGRRAEGSRGYAETTHFTLTHDAPQGEEPTAAPLVRALVAFVLQLRDHEGLSVVFPAPGEDVRPLILAAPTEEAATPPAEPGALNLDLASDCLQHCSFCSLRELSPARDGGAQLLRKLCDDLQASRDRGVRHLRLLGYDPLAFSGVLEVARRARQLDYRRVDIYSPCTRLADPAFCEALLAVLPVEHCFHVPLYAVEPALHDTIVGRPGAHALVLTALEVLLARVGPGGVRLISLALRDNLAEFPRLAAFAAERGLPLSAILPYPSQESPEDGFFRVMPRLTEVALALAEVRRAGHVVRVGLRSSNGPPEWQAGAATGRREVRVEGLAPCVAYPHLATLGLSVRDWLELPEEGGGPQHERLAVHEDAPPTLPVVDAPTPRQYHAATVQCPHAARCVLRTACSQELLRSYVELHGIDELQPITLGALLLHEAALAAGPGTPS